MFASNQTFQISGTMRQIADVIDFGIKHAGKHDMLTRFERRVVPTFQITPNGIYIIGTGWMKSEEPSLKRIRLYDGWTEYPFDYDPKIIAPIIEQWLLSQPKPDSEYEYADGGHDTGFLCTSMKELYKEMDVSNAVQNANWGVLAFRPYRNWYAK